jgi:hypothetical protein
MSALDDVTPSDEDGKVRRNLVAFSAAVVLLAWLQIPLASVAEKLLGTSHHSLNPLRAWTAGAVVLFYLAVRFHFSGGGKAAFAELTKLWQTLAHWDLDARMKAVPGQWTKQKWLGTPIEEVLQRAEATFTLSGYAGTRERHVILRQDISKNEARWTFSGRSHVEVTYWNPKSEPRTHILSHSEEVSYSLPWWVCVLVSAKALWSSWLYSEQAVAWMFPVWLALAASGVVGYRLGQIGFGM